RARRAEAAAQRDAEEARVQSARSRRTLAFVEHVLAGADVRNTGGKNWTMSDLLGALAARAEAELADDPKVACAVYNMIGSSYMAISDFDRATAFLDRAENLSREKFGEGSAEHAQSVLEQAHLARDRNNIAEATRLGRRGLAML